MKTFSPGLSDSIASVLSDPQRCPHCDSSSQVGGGLCVGCLLESGLDPEGGCEPDALLSELAEIQLPDQNWRLGNYEILEEIGRGGMGVIYRARQRHSRRIVAVKRVLSYHADSRETLARFRREAQAAASLDHPNILPIYEVSESEDGLPYFSMKFAPGGTLQQVASALRNDPRQCVALVAKVVRAVQYAHSRGILHRDLKPANVLLDGRGEPLVSDFGLAKWLDATTDLTRTLTIFGTPGYIAPEQASQAAAELKPTADIYSLGAILFDLLAGRPPFLGSHALSVIRQAAETTAPKLRTLTKLADRDLETICSRCLEREPKLRYQSAHDLAEDLERWLEGRSIIARPISPPIRVWRWSKRNPKLAASIAGCLMLGIVAGAVEARNRVAQHAAALAMHSIAVEPFLNLDSARDETSVSTSLAVALETELSRSGPARVTPVSGHVSFEMPRWNGARAALVGTQRTRDGKLRVSLRLINVADGKVLYRRVIEATGSSDAANKAAELTAPTIHAILNRTNLVSAELPETDPGWQDENTRELLVAGIAVQDRRTLVDIDRSMELFRKATSNQPGSALAYSHLAQSQVAHAYFTGDHDYVLAAQVSADKALRLNGNMAEAHKAASMVLFQQGQFSQSLEAAFTALELADSHQDYRLINRIPGNLRMLGQPGKAAEWYRLSFKQTGRPHDSYSLADCYSDLADDDAAAAAYTRAAYLFPEHADGWIGLCRLALLLKDFSKAQQIASENWTKYRDHIIGAQMAAQVLFFSRNFADAEKLYQELAAKDPNGGGSFYGAISYRSAIGRLRLAAHDDKNGTRMLEEALQREAETLSSAPEHPEVLYRIAAIESSLGRIEPALEHLQAAIRAGWIDYRSLKLDPRFDRIRDGDTFKNILTWLSIKVAELRRQQSGRKTDSNPNK
ncbi:MAG TPA: protein kinase [Chthoniobacterales bacterium]|jgi:serine/threonine protein kinase/tetratricopeptide (TPR) repeat protein|nr:protein kinase [Chthoniobacterales bacterium]